MEAFFFLGFLVSAIRNRGNSSFQMLKKLWMWVPRCWNQIANREMIRMPIVHRHAMYSEKELTWGTKFCLLQLYLHSRLPLLLFCKIHPVVPNLCKRPFDHFLLSLATLALVSKYGKGSSLRKVALLFQSGRPRTHSTRPRETWFGVIIWGKNWLISPYHNTIKSNTHLQQCSHIFSLR